jgi:hypothetical protein
MSCVIRASFGLGPPASRWGALNAKLASATRPDLGGAEIPKTESEALLDSEFKCSNNNFAFQGVTLVSVSIYCRITRFRPISWHDRHRSASETTATVLGVAHSSARLSRRPDRRPLARGPIPARPLTDNGRRLAKRLKPILARNAFKLALCCPLRRARETCELAGFGDAAVIDADLGRVGLWRLRGTDSEADS